MEVKCKECRGCGEVEFEECGNAYTKGYIRCEECKGRGSIQIEIPEKFYTKFGVRTFSELLKKQKQLKEDILRLEALYDKARDEYREVSEFWKAQETGGNSPAVKAAIAAVVEEIKQMSPEKLAEEIANCKDTTFQDLFAMTGLCPVVEVEDDD